jgi:hypothetical protein
VLARVHIQASDFYQPRAEATWQALAAVNGAPDRARAVLDHWRTTGQLRPGHLDGAWLHDCTTACLTPTAAQQYADRVRADAAHRRAAAALTAALTRLDRDPDPQLPGSLLLDAMEQLEDGYRGISGGPARTPDTTWHAVDIAAVLDGHDLDPPPVLMPRTDGHCLLYPGAVHTISGEPESGKTFACLYAATVELARGSHVAVVDFEDRAGRVVRRLLDLGAHPDQVAAGLRYVRPHEPIATRDRDGTWRDNPDAATALLQAVTGTVLVVLDGVTEAMTVHGLDLNSNSDVAAFYDLLPRRITRQGPAVVLIDHVVKDSERQGRWGIGGQHKLAGIDGAAYLVKVAEPFGRGQRGRARLIVSKDRPGHVVEHSIGRCAAEFVLDSTIPDVTRAWLEPPTTMPVDDAGDQRPTIYMERVSRYVEVHSGCTSREIKESVNGKREYVMRALAALIREGFVEFDAGPRGAQLHRSREPFRRDDEDRS